VTSRTVVLASFVALAASAAWAQEPRVEISGMAGWTLSDGVSGNSVLAGDGNLYNGIEPKDSFAYTLDLGFYVNENVEIGGLFGQQKSKMVITGLTNLELGDWSVDNYHGVITYNFGDHSSRARPYVFGGAGVTHYSGVSFETVATPHQTREIGGNSQFSTTWGLGVKVYPGHNVGIKLGVRWTPTYIKSDATGWWCDPYWGCYLVGNAQYSNQFEFGGGLTFRF
jgi:outer membrane protein W